MRVLVAMLILLCTTFHSEGAVVVSRERCDELIAGLSKDDPWLKRPDGSALAWGEAGIIHAFVDMYEATGDPKYLREVVRRGDRMLSHRDDRRGVKDSTGKVHKAWSMAMKYTVAEGVLNDASGMPVIRLRSTPYAYNDQTKVEVTASGSAFAVRASNEHWKRKETFSDLSADPSSPRYFERIVNNPVPTPGCAPGECTRPSQLLKAIPLDKNIGLPKTQSLDLKPLPLAYCGYIGIIYYPLLRFAEIVRAAPSLEEFLPAAERFAKAADESYDEFRTHWRDGPGEDEGYYITCERGGAFPWDNLPEPFNYLGMHVSAELALHRLTGKAVYKDDATRMANLFKNRLKLMPGDLYVWYYWYEPVTTGWTKENSPSENFPELAPRLSVEDNSHGTLDIQLVVNCARAGIVFDQTDLRRFANTFLKNLVRPDYSGLNARVDGTPPIERLARTGITGWLPLAEADPAVYDACLKIYQTRDVEGFTALARLLKWKKLLGR